MNFNTSKTIALILFLIGNLSLSAQEWVRQNPFVILTDLEDIYISPDGYGWAVGDEGSILHTTDYGNLWVPQYPNQPDVLFKTVAYEEGSSGQKVMAGGASTLIKSSNGGQSWSTVNTGTSIAAIIDMEWPVANRLYIGGTKLIRSTDGGQSWADITPGLGSNWQIDFLNANEGWASASGSFYHTTDGGDSWTMQNAFSAQVRYFDFVNTTIGFVNTGRDLYKSTDGGENWTLFEDAFGHTTSGLLAFDENNLMVSFNNAVIIGVRSSDGGQNWETMEPEQPQSRNFGIAALSKDQVWVVGEFSKIAYTNNNGDDWHDQIPGNKEPILDIHFLDSQRGIACGRNNSLLFTQNGGNSWNPASWPTSGNLNLSSVYFYDAQHAWIAKLGLFSDDGGASWESLSGGVAGNSIFATSPDDVYIVTSNGRIAYSSDGGQNFMDQYNVGNNLRFHKIYFTDAQNGWVCGWNGEVLRTTNGGTNWNVAFSYPGGKFTGIDFSEDGQTGWLVAEAPRDTCWRSTDGGQSWQPVKLPRSTFWQDIHFMDVDTGYIAGGSVGSGIILKSTDGGISWVEDYEGSYRLNAIHPLDESGQAVWAAGHAGNILFYSSCGSAPILTALDGPETPCEGDTVSYLATTHNVSVYTWTLPPGWNVFGNSNTANLSVIVGPDAGTISVQGSNTCENTGTISVSVSSLPQPDAAVITFDGSTLSTTTQADQYQWYFNGQPINGATAASHIPQANGTYYLRIGASNCFSPPSNTIEVMSVGIQHPQIEQLIVYPNPGNNYLYLTNAPAGTLSLYDIYGRRLRQLVVQGQRINTANLTAGVYILKLQTAVGLYCGKWEKR